MGRIITISGVSGTGKTTLTEHILSLGAQYRIIESATTRPPRDRDRHGEFLYLSTIDFLRMDAENEFLWVTPPIHGVNYGTRRESIENALLGPGIFVMVITIGYLPLLFAYAKEYTSQITGLYIRSPGETILRERLSAHGDQDIERRINECQNWDAQAKQLGERIPIHFVDNTKTLAEFFENARSYIL